MEFKTVKKKKTSEDSRIAPLPCVSKIKVPEIPHRVTLTERSWPFLFSIALHAVLFVILFFPALQLPFIKISQAPTVLWFTPFIASGNSGHMASMLSQPAVAFAHEVKAEPVSRDMPEDPVTSDHPPAQTAIRSIEPVEKPTNVDSIIIPIPPKVPSEIDAPASRQTMPLYVPLVNRNPTLSSSKPSRHGQAVPQAEQHGITMPVQERLSGETAADHDEAGRLSRELVEQKQALADIAHQEQLVLKQEQQAIREQSERERIAADKLRQEQEAQVKLQHLRKIQQEQERLTAERTRQAQLIEEQARQTIRERSELERVAADKLRQEQEAQVKLQHLRKIQQEQERLTAERKLQTQEQQLRERKLQGEIMRVKDRETPLEQPLHRALQAANKQENPADRVSENHTAKPPVQQPDIGLVIPLLKGDLKLVLAGSMLPKINITFKEFALSRRDRPFSRSETRRGTTIIPLIATSRENSFEVVIEKTLPGVYTITFAADKEKTDVKFSLKLFEGSSRAITRELGRLAIDNKKVVLKILMPDGIIWDDNTAFSGNMEDSDGVTKFNTKTGLMWKEYAE